MNARRGWRDGSKSRPSAEFITTEILSGGTPRAIESSRSGSWTAARVTLHGRVLIDELPGLLAAADIGLVPSLPEPYLQYSLSTKLLEYAAMGVPALATRLAPF